MFVLVENNNVILGPIHWNQRMFQSVINDELEIVANIPMSNNKSLPVDVTDIVKILPAVLVYPDTHNQKIEQLAGPMWTITPTLATGTFVNAPKDIKVVQNELKAIVADNRWKQEVSGIKVIIQGQELSISTARDNRDIYMRALQLNQDGNKWKFGNIWLTLSIVELQTIVDAIITHVQSAFDWEHTKISEIDGATDLSMLDAILLMYPQ